MKFKLISSLAILGCALLGYKAWESTIVPEDIPAEEVSTVKTLDFIMWLVGLMDRALEYSGIQPRPIIRKLLSSLAKIPESHAFNPHIQVHEEEMAGVPVLHFKYDSSESVRTTPGAIIIYFHGGGWQVLNSRSPFALLSNLTESLRIPSLSVEYRLAPEYPYPAAFEDCLKVTNYVLTNHKRLAVDPNKIIVAGDSAGGNLAAAVALKLKKKIRLQVLIFPTLQAFDFQTPSYREHADTLKHILSPRKMVSYAFDYAGLPQSALHLMRSNKHISKSTRSKYGSYVHSDLVKDSSFSQLSSLPHSTMSYGSDAALVKDIETRVLDSFFAPLMADTLDNVTDAYVITGQHDILRDDGIFYCSRLSQAANVRCELRNYKQGFHGFIHFLVGPLRITSAKQAVADLIEHLKTVI
ncbi:neutral cholesterol ester hydrolase 1-like [Watersipora subatra]|uniref:neutral cholesterol ester hydrolase 1-like n=1 Tax=Watersipora subatra TaxID=2589382 RepID=UPI00355B101D